MKTYAVFLFDDSKEGFEKHTFVEDMKTQNLEHDYLKIYYCRLIENVHFSKLTVNHLEMKIRINDIKFADQYSVYIPRTSKAIVLAERIK